MWTERMLCHHLLWFQDAPSISIYLKISSEIPELKGSNKAMQAKRFGYPRTILTKPLWTLVLWCNGLHSGFWIQRSRFKSASMRSCQTWWLQTRVGISHTYQCTPCGTRTRNLRIRSPTPCPLGQGGNVWIFAVYMWNFWSRMAVIAVHAPSLI